jgi:cellobiose phosphorylase
MRYGYFDDSNNEYVIERPDTPKGWINYSGSRNYGSVITNNAGGYSFYRSPALGRFLRFWHNAIPYDQPGRYIYLRDDDDGDYWSGSWQPVGKPLDKYETTCRFGTQYTVIKSIYAEIESETTYFVPLNQNFEYWKVKITNNSSKIRNLSIYTYIEFSSEWNFFQDHFNLQYSGFIVKTKIDNGIAECSSLGNLPADKDNFANGDQGRWSWITLAGTNITGYELDREAFIGPYRSYNNPQTVENGVCVNTTAFGDNGCGSLQTKIMLQPGESKEFLVIMGIGKGSEEGAKIKEEYGTLEKAEEELTKLKD